MIVYPSFAPTKNLYSETNHSYGCHARLHLSARQAIALGIFWPGQNRMIMGLDWKNAGIWCSRKWFTNGDDESWQALTWNDVFGLWQLIAFCMSSAGLTYSWIKASDDVDNPQAHQEALFEFSRQNMQFDERSFAGSTTLRLVALPSVTKTLAPLLVF
jgi:hypothetical protein